MIVDSCASGRRAAFSRLDFRLVARAIFSGRGHSRRDVPVRHRPLGPDGALPVAVLAPGFVLSVLRERSGSVKPAVLGHAIYNLIGWLLLVLAGLFLTR